MKYKIKFWTDKNEIINYLKNVNNKYEYEIIDNNDENNEQFFYKFTIKNDKQQQTYYVKELDWNLNHFRKVINKLDKGAK